MAKQYKNNRKRKPRYSELERLAFKMALIEQGRKRDTKVKDAYEKGLAGKEKKTRKPVC